MTKAQQSGFTLVELLIVSVLTALTLAGIYQTLMVQEKSYEAASLMIRDQEAVRTAIGILETELREVGAIGGADIGETDIAVATPDSIRFRAQRKVGFICQTLPLSNALIVRALGDEFESGDNLLLFVENDSTQFNDDEWDTTAVSTVSASTSTACNNFFPGHPLQLLAVGHDLNGVRDRSPLRSYEWITYGLYDFGPLGWGLGRVRAGQSNPDYLVGGLADIGTGLQLSYFDTTNSSTTDPTEISRIRITIRTDPETNTSVEALEMTSNLFLRNN